MVGDSFSEPPDGRASGGSKPTRRSPVSDGGRVDLDAIFACFTSRRRRYVLYYCRHNEVATFDEIAGRVAARELGRPPASVPAEVRDRVRTAIYHEHLPKLADAGFVEFDRRSETVRYRDVSRPIELLVRLAEFVDRIED